MKKNALEYIIRKSLKEMMREQAEQTDSAIETDNAPSSAKDSPFTPAEERFLGKFDAYGSNHLGIVYSPSITGIREFVARSGKELNVTPGILLSLLRKKIIKLVPYTGFGRNDDYTIELQLSLDDVKGLGDADKAKAEKGSSAPAGGGMDMGAAATTPAPENAGYVRKGNLIEEAVEFAIGKTDSRIKSGLDFWTKLHDAMPDGVFSNWDEEAIYNAFKMHVKNVSTAVVIDAIGVLIYNSSVSNKFSDDAQQTIDAIVKYGAFPEIPRVDGSYVYTIKQFMNNKTIYSYAIFQTTHTSYLKEYQTLLQNRGIGKIYADGDYRQHTFYPTYSSNEIWDTYFNIIKAFKPKK
jgi:hypothetical protein